MMTISEQLPLKIGDIVYKAEINIPKEIHKIEKVQIILVILEEELVEDFYNNLPVLRKLTDNSNPYEHLRKLVSCNYYEIPLEQGFILRDTSLKESLLYRLFHSPTQALDYIKNEINILKQRA